MRGRDVGLPDGLFEVPPGVSGLPDEGLPYPDGLFGEERPDECPGLFPVLLVVVVVLPVPAKLGDVVVPEGITGVEPDLLVGVDEPGPAVLVSEWVKVYVTSSMILPLLV